MQDGVALTCAPQFLFRFHGKGGPMPVELFKFRTPSAHLFVEACRQNGIDFVRDYNGANQFGVTFQQMSSKDGSRFSTARAYLKPVHQRRPNLTILLGRHKCCSDQSVQARVLWLDSFEEIPNITNYKATHLVANLDWDVPPSCLGSR